MEIREDDGDQLVAYLIGRRPALEIVPAPRTREWMLKTSKSFANRCLPLLMANESGWWLLNRHAFSARWNGGPRREDLELTFDDPRRHGSAATSLFGHGILTWAIPCVFRTPAGVELLVRGPANLPKDGASALEGLVETDWIEATFTMNWKLTRPELPVRFERGEPYAMVVPQGRADLERFAPVVRALSDDPELRERVRRWAERRQREQVRAFAVQHVPEIGGPEWDGAYMRGVRDDGSSYEEHRVRRALRPFMPPRT